MELQKSFALEVSTLQQQHTEQVNTTVSLLWHVDHGTVNIQYTPCFEMYDFRKN
jgi:hypothetical protein